MTCMQWKLCLTIDRLLDSTPDLDDATVYLVKWRHWPASGATWEPAHMLGKALIADYHAALPRSQRGGGGGHHPIYNNVNDSDFDEELRKQYNSQAHVSKKGN